ncbi:MAG: hypothetical protein B6I19_10760 [Bacteroidetes bacterium 4572_114]|nr:MAG: hypothetical protein B6I19_10760 [Bacteroidetes bacterium 4572_114]
MNAVKILINGIMPTLKEVFFIRYEYWISELEEVMRVSLINSQGTIAHISQGTKGRPLSITRIFRP